MDQSWAPLAESGGTSRGDGLAYARSDGLRTFLRDRLFFRNLQSLSWGCQAVQCAERQSSNYLGNWCELNSATVRSSTSFGYLLHEPGTAMKSESSCHIMPHLYCSWRGSGILCLTSWTCAWRLRYFVVLSLIDLILIGSWVLELGEEHHCQAKAVPRAEMSSTSLAKVTSAFRTLCPGHSSLGPALTDWSVPKDRLVLAHFFQPPHMKTDEIEWVCVDWCGPWTLHGLSCRSIMSRFTIAKFWERHCHKWTEQEVYPLRSFSCCCSEQDCCKRCSRVPRVQQECSSSSGAGSLA